jgi:hypothetical protein
MCGAPCALLFCRSFLLNAPRLAALLGAAVCSDVTTVGALQVRASA